MITGHATEDLTYASSTSHRHEDYNALRTSGNTDSEQREVTRFAADALYAQPRQLVKSLEGVMHKIQLPHEPTSLRSDIWLEPVIPWEHDAGPTQEKYMIQFWSINMGRWISELSHPWKPPIMEADSKEDVIALIRRFGLETTADRLAYLDKLAEDDPEEEHFGLESLRRFAAFVLDRHLPPPKIGISPGGLVHAVWWVTDGILSMDFLPSGKVRFAAVIQDEKWSTRGVLPLDRMMEKIELFTRALHR